MQQKTLDNQLNLINSEDSSNEIFRPIHYLGSKLRILDFLENTIDSIDASRGSVCDLFSGSGSVSFKLSKTRKVTSVDIQNYSKVINSAILNPSIPDNSTIEEFLNECENSSFLERFLDSVSSLIEFEEMGIKSAVIENKPIHLCDILENGSVISYEILKKSKASTILAKNIKNSIKALGKENIPLNKSIVFRYFGGIYFSYKQSVEIDAILNQIDTLVNKKYEDFFMAALLSTVSDAVNTVGKQFAQPIRPRKSNGEIKPTLGKMANKDRGLSIFSLYKKWIGRYSKLISTPFQHTILNMDYSVALNHLPNDTSVVYADPPYTRDHYSRYYHVLETVSLRDNPEVSTMVLKGKELLSRGLYRKKRHQSPFCIRSKAPDAFDIMFSKTKEIGAKLVLSYSPFNKVAKVHPRVVSLELLTKIAKKYYNNVELISVGNFSHSKLNHSEKHLKASSNAEVLLVCQ